jgi:hypothetical protein
MSYLILKEVLLAVVAVIVRPFSVTQPPCYIWSLKKPSWSSEDFWVLSICYNQIFATLSFFPLHLFPRF